MCTDQLLYNRLKLLIFWKGALKNHACWT